LDAPTPPRIALPEQVGAGPALYQPQPPAPNFAAMAQQYNQLLSQTLTTEDYARFLKEYEATVRLAQARAALIRARAELEKVEQDHKDTKAGKQAAELLKLVPDKAKLAIQDPLLLPQPGEKATATKPMAVELPKSMNDSPKPFDEPPKNAN
jgi:hypothetical protein